ncbi:MAG: hypothetical protein ACOCQG_05920 [Candidatus Nanoarchaeia archaeon]
MSDKKSELEAYLERYRQNEEYQTDEESGRKSNDYEDVWEENSRSKKMNKPVQTKYKPGLTRKQIESKVNALNRKVNFASLQPAEKLKFGVKYLLSRGMDVLDNIDLAQYQKDKLEHMTQKMYNHLERLSENREYLDESSASYVEDSCDFEQKYRAASQRFEKYGEEKQEHLEMLKKVDKYSPEFFEIYKNYQKAKNLHFDAFKEKSVNYAKRNSCIKSLEKVEALTQFNNSVEFDMEHMLIQNLELQGESEIYHTTMRTLIDAIKEATSTEDYHSRVSECLKHYDNFKSHLQSAYHNRIRDKMKFED